MSVSAWQVFLRRGWYLSILSLHTSHFILHTSYFLSPCPAWWRRSTTQQAAARLRLYFILHTSYHHALHGGDAVRRSRLRLDSVSTLYFTSYFILHTSCFVTSHRARRGRDGNPNVMWHGCFRVDQSMVILWRTWPTNSLVLTIPNTGVVLVTKLRKHGMINNVIT